MMKGGSTRALNQLISMERGRVDALLTQLNDNEREMALQRSEIARLRVMVDGPEEPNIAVRPRGPSADAGGGGGQASSGAPEDAGAGTGGEFGGGGINRLRPEIGRPLTAIPAGRRDRGVFPYSSSSPSGAAGTHDMTGNVISGRHIGGGGSGDVNSVVYTRGSASGGAASGATFGGVRSGGGGGAFTRSSRRPGSAYTPSSSSSSFLTATASRDVGAGDATEPLAAVVPTRPTSDRVPRISGPH